MRNNIVSLRLVPRTYRLPNANGKKISMGKTHLYASASFELKNGNNALRNDSTLRALMWSKNPILLRTVKTQSGREIETAIDIESALVRHGRQAALAVAHLWNAPACVIRYLKTGKKTLRRAALKAIHEAISRNGLREYKHKAICAAEFALRTDAAGGAIAIGYANWALEILSTKDHTRKFNNRRNKLFIKPILALAA